MNKQEYLSYLQSSHWKAFRKKFFESHWRRCIGCHVTKKLHLHHKTYKNLGQEKDSDVCILCKRCHFKLHKLMEKMSQEAAFKKIKFRK